MCVSVWGWDGGGGLEPAAAPNYGGIEAAWRLRGIQRMQRRCVGPVGARSACCSCCPCCGRQWQQAVCPDCLHCSRCCCCCC